MSKARLRVVFFGNGYDYSLAFLRALASSGAELVGVVVPVGTPERREWPHAARAARAKRSPQEPLDPDLKYAWWVGRLCEQRGARDLWPQKLRSPGCAEQIAGWGADLIVMAGFNEILRAEALGKLPPVLNVHPSLLPLYRGPHPEFWTVASGAREAGVTIHLVDAGVDTGPVVASQRFEVEPWLTGGELQQRAMSEGAVLLTELLDDGFDPRASPSWVQEGGGSYQGLVTDEDLVVPFEGPCQRAYDLSRAAAPWMSLTLYVPSRWWSLPVGPRSTAAAARKHAPGTVGISLSEAQAYPNHHLGPPGTVCRSEGGALAVACADGTVVFRRTVAFT